jgi:hypothetical protein
VDPAISRPVASGQLSVLEYLAGQLSYVTVDSARGLSLTRPEKAGRAAGKATSNCTPTAVSSYREPVAVRRAEWAASPPGVSIVKTEVVEQACADLEALVLQVLRTLRIDSPMRVQASVASEGQLPTVPIPRMGCQGRLALGVCLMSLSSPGPPAGRVVRHPGPEPVLPGRGQGRSASL